MTHTQEKKQSMEKINGDDQDVEISRHEENMLVMNKAEDLRKVELRSVYEINLRMQRPEMGEQ